MGNRLSEMERSSAVSFAFVVEHSHSFGSSVRIMGGTYDGTIMLWHILASLSEKRPGSTVYSRRCCEAWKAPPSRADNRK